MKMLKSLLMAMVAVAGLSMASCGGNADSKDNAEAKTEAQAEETSTDKAPLDLDNLKADLTVVDFNAVWCGPCKQFAPIFEAAAEKYAGKIDFVEVDIDNYPELAEHFGVEAIPMVVLLDSKGNVVNQNVGFMDADQFEVFLSGKIEE
ncbi:MAG: thioredoxin fold domain-containing protein [Bacteroidales bacterium]|nr:thioredoxin fold domain-containing protein [Bacteroidales bacterium]